jgi:hypothetical protein
VRRIVWDGEQELYEIQMPGQDGSTLLENDTAQVKLDAIYDNIDTGLWYDPNVYYGRVAHTPGPSIDQPLSVIRFGYRSVMDQDGKVRTPLVWSPFAITPLWSPKGQADLGTFEDGRLDKCTVFENVTRCVWRDWLAQVHAYNRSRARRNVWHGSALEDKQDAAGTLYRRNRAGPETHPGRSDRARGGAQPLRVRQRRPGQFLRSVWADVVSANVRADTDARAGRAARTDAYSSDDGGSRRGPANCCERGERCHPR